MQGRAAAYVLILVLAALLGLGACSPPVRSDRMAPAPTGDTQFAADSALREAVAVKDVGGGEPIDVRGT